MNDPDRPVRIAIVGAGNVAETSHLPAIQAQGPNADIVAVVDVDPERARDFAERWQIAACYRDLDTMLREATPDLVIVCTPPVAHREAVVTCLEAGVWVWCEKPPTLSLAEYDEIASHEVEGGPYVSYVFQQRFGSSARALRDHIRNGRLGNPLIGICHTLWYRDDAYYEVPWRGKWNTEGGGPTMGHGIHQMDLMLSLMGEWTEVRAAAGTLARHVETEDASMAIVRFASGAMVSMVNSVLSPRETSYLRFDFPEATVELSHLYGYDNGDWRWTPAPHRVGDSPADLGAPEANDPSSHTVQLRHLIDDLRRRRRPEASGDDGRRVLAFIAALYQSADTGEPVTPRLITADNPYYHSMNGQPQQHTSIPRRTAAMADTAFQIHDDHRGGQLTVVAADTEIATYVYRPEAPREESPKPYLYPLRTLSGAPLAVFRPWDHRWHKGLQMTLSHVSGQNFWGGPTFEQGAPGHGYVWRENNGAQLHRGFGRVDAGGSEVSVIQRLDWAAATGENWLAETRTLRFHSADVARGIWALDFATELTNAHTETLELGSPTTHGRPDAGYTGLFWRGPRAFTSARIIADGADDDEVMGSAGAWAAISGEHDGIDGGATILAYAGTSSAQAPIKWFSRSDPFACLNPSPAFDAEIKLEPGQILTLRHRFVFIDHSTDRSTLEPLVDEFAL